MFNEKYLAGQNALDISHLDFEVDAFAQRRQLQLTPEMQMLLRDAMLWMASSIADEIVSVAAPDDDSERRWTKCELAVYDAMTRFAKVKNSWIDRTRLALGLPERDFKTLRDSIEKKCQSSIKIPRRQIF
jgi:hypothetical protein